MCELKVLKNLSSEYQIGFAQPWSTLEIWQITLKTDHEKTLKVLLRKK